ncbi:MAG TPA: error-prone DNA polymerase [Gemmatimonadaceae bacterium]|nr:error-prone DNA polymerase [Gemmatimonadaceae bacterium]
MAVPFVELRAHSAFSFNAAATSPETLAARAAAFGYSALGLTDCADLGGIVRFALECARQGIRPIVGTELVVDGKPLALLARTAEGYRNIGALITRSRSGELRTWTKPEGTTRKGVPDGPPRGFPVLAWHDVAARAEGLIALSGPPNGQLASLVRGGRRGEAARLLAEWREVFGAENVAVEVQHHAAGRGEEALAAALIELAERERVPWMVAGDARYALPEERRALDVLTALRHECTIDEAAARGLLLPNEEWMLLPPERVVERWAGREAGLAATVEIASRCDFSLAWVRPPLPAFPVPAWASADAWLRVRAYEGARERWGEQLSEAQVKQIEHELTVIAKLGFSGFFLVMHDAVREARRRGILCQGRGSAANSAITFCLGVTAVDPVKHGLLFERFLSESRVDGLTEAPDIDVDIEHDRREEILDYVYERYGRAHAAIACIVQMYSAPTAIQDCMRAFGYEPEQAFALSKRLHYAEPSTGVEKLREGMAKEFGLDLETPRGEALLRAIGAFDGLPRMRSTHPGGFALSAAPIGDYCPVEPTTMGRTILQYDKDDLDAVGIPKFDFLGLGALAMTRRAFDVIEARTGKRPELYALPQDDPATFAMIAKGDTLGTFQIESRAQIASLVHTRPERLYDIVVQVALIRPGPIQARFVHPYTERRRGREEVTFAHPALADVLARTMGIPIFQEQAMRISQVLAGYSAAEADELRRTMGNQRKQARLVAALTRLRDRMVERGVEQKVAEQITEDLQSFANYGFPESHAWSFALIAYATSYLKAHHPTEFYIGILNAQPMGFYSVATLVQDARRHGVVVRLPCLAGGDADCTAEEAEDPAHPALRLGWRFIRGIGDRSLETLKSARAAGPYTSIADVVRRAKLNRADAAALARAHAFAAWEPDRRRAAWQAMRAVGDVLPLAPSRGDDFAPRQLDHHAAVVADYNALGLSISGHPMERFRPWLRRMGARDTAEVQQCRHGEQVILAGLVIVRQRPQSAKGTVFVLLEDEHGQTQVIVSRKMDEANYEVVRFSTFLAVYGRVERDGPLASIVATGFRRLDPEEEGAEALVYHSHDFH